MSRTRKNQPSVGKAPSSNNSPEWGGFIDVRMEEQDKADFRVWSEQNGEQVWIDFLDLLGSGFKFGLSYDRQGDFYLATFTAHGRELIGLEDRYCLTARAPNWETALALLVFKHLIMTGGNWGAYRPKQRQIDNFG
jgi:hypothetical protein